MPEIVFTAFKLLIVFALLGAYYFFNIKRMKIEEEYDRQVGVESFSTGKNY